METRKRIAFSFYIKRTKLNKSGEAPIYAKITVEDTQDEFAVLRNIYPEKWSKEKNGAVGTTKEARELNEYLYRVRGNLQEHAKTLLESGADMEKIYEKY